MNPFRGAVLAAILGLLAWIALVLLIVAGWEVLT